MNWEQVRSECIRLGFPFREELPDAVDVTFSSDIPAEFFTAHPIVLFVDESTGVLTAAITTPRHTLALDALASTTGQNIRPVAAPVSEITRLLTLRSRLLLKSVDQLLTESSETIQSFQPGGEPDLTATGPDDPYVVQLVNAMITEAAERRTSDIHIEPGAGRLRIRYRIDGMLQEGFKPPDRFKDYIISRIKLMAHLDITQRREPQDGSMAVHIAGKPVDIRVSAVPTPNGERIVLRLLGRTEHQTDLANLGMPLPMIGAIDAILRQTQGLVLFAGPTGSGKTTTLYACLHRIDISSRNTITIEDPVEYQIPGISQIQCGSKKGMGFAEALRSILRQDPDVIMVGEIRDGETASLAFRASLTGHLILSSIHTFDPAGAIIRLLDLGVDSALIAETLSSVIDQRLIRLRCQVCHSPNKNHPAVSSPVCPNCDGSGYRGRTGLFRQLPLDEALRKAIRTKDYDYIKQSGISAYGNAYQYQTDHLLANNLTTSEEIRRLLDETRG